MSGKAFLDTNIFVYMQSAPETEKKELCFRALDNFECVASTQVLNELCNVLLKKFNMKTEDVAQVITAVDSACEMSVVTVETVETALRLKERYGYSYYDSLILASALACDCDYLFSEDMSDSQMIENRLEIVNIFARPAFINKDGKD